MVQANFGLTAEQRTRAREELEKAQKEHARRVEEMDERLAKEAQQLTDAKTVIESLRRDLQNRDNRITTLEKEAKRQPLVSDQARAALETQKSKIEELDRQVSDLQMQLARAIKDKQEALMAKEMNESDLRHAEALRSQAEQARQDRDAMVSQGGSGGEVAKSAIRALKDRELSVLELTTRLDKVTLELAKRDDQVRTLEVRLEAANATENSLQGLLRVESSGREEMMSQLSQKMITWHSAEAERARKDSDQQIALQYYETQVSSLQQRLQATDQYYSSMKSVYEQGIEEARKQQMGFILSMKAHTQEMLEQRAAEAERMLLTARSQTATWLDVQAQAFQMMEWTHQNSAMMSQVMSLAQRSRDLYLESSQLPISGMPQFIKQKIDPWITECYNSFRAIQETNKEAAGFLYDTVRRVLEDRTNTASMAKLTMGEEAVETLYVQPDGTVSHHPVVEARPLEAPPKSSEGQLIVWGKGF
jgi:chromosome segregation ATPase